MNGSQFSRAMKSAGVSASLMAALAGVSRSQVWRWRTEKTPVPAYAVTIVEQQRRIRDLTERLIELT